MVKEHASQIEEADTTRLRRKSDTTVKEGSCKQGKGMKSWTVIIGFNVFI